MAQKKSVLESLDRPYDPYQPRRLFKSARDRETIEYQERTMRAHEEWKERQKRAGEEAKDRAEWEYRKRGLPW